MSKGREANIDTILKIVKYLLICGVSAGLLYLSARLFPYLLPVFMGMLLAEAATFLVSLIRSSTHRLFKRKREIVLRHDGDKLAVFLYFVIIIGVVALIIFLITVGISQVRSLIENLPQSLRSINISASLSDVLERLGDESIKDTVLTSLEQTLQTLSSRVVSYGSRVMSWIGILMNGLPLFLLTVMISLMCGYYSINGSRRIYARALRLTQNRELVRNSFFLISQVVNTIFRIVGGYILLMFITFLECLIGFLILNVPNSLTWAIVAAIIDVLPILGVMAVLLPMAIYFFITASFLTGAGIILLLVVMTVLRRFWEPLVLGSVMRINPLITIFSMIAGIKFWGLSGAILGPIYFVTLLQFFRVFRIEDKLRVFIAAKTKKNVQKSPQHPE